MDISEQERDDIVRTYINEGLTLSQIQKALAEKFDLHLTYMDLRLLAADLQANWEKQDAKLEAARSGSQPPQKSRQPVPETPETGSGAASPMSDTADDSADFDGNREEESGSGTKVEVSPIARPGTSMGGTVKFGSGASGEWYIDGMGRVGFEPSEGSAKPTPQDIQEFQVELRKALGY